MGIEYIYKMLVDGKVLNDNNLEKEGYTKEDISNLISTNKIVLLDDCYELVNVEDFFKYATLQLIQRNISYANACFYKCYELCPNNIKYCHQVLTIELKRQNKTDYKNYEKAFEFFLSLEKNAKKDLEVNTSKLYLFLFSYIYSDMPEVYKKKVSNIKWFDLILERKPSNKDENEIRTAIIRRRFKYAIELLDKLIRKQNNYSIRYESLRALLNEVIDAEKIFNNNLLDLMNEEKYEEIVGILESRSRMMSLTITEENILMVVKSIIEIINTNEIPLIENKMSDNLRDILSSNNFELAYSLVVTFIEEHNLDKSNNILYLALVNINNLILNIKNKKINDMEEYAYFLKAENISLEQAFKKYGLTLKSLLLIKLIYARDYYIESEYLEGDALLKEVEAYKGRFLEVDELIEELKINRDKLKDKLDIYIKSRNKKNG